MTRPAILHLQGVVRFLFFLVNVFCASTCCCAGTTCPAAASSPDLATAISLILLSLAIGFEELHRVMRFDPVRLAAVGLAARHVDRHARRCC